MAPIGTGVVMACKTSFMNKKINIALRLMLYTYTFLLSKTDFCCNMEYLA